MASAHLSTDRNFRLKRDDMTVNCAVRFRLPVGAAGIMLSAVFFAGLARAEPSMQEIKDKVIAYRTQIQQGTLRITTIIDVNTDLSAGYERQESTLKVVFRSQGIRAERHQVSIVNGAPLTFTQRRILTGGEAIYDEMKPNIAVEVVKEQDMGAQARDDLLDPRVCGLILGPICTWDQFGLDDAISLWDREPASVRAEGADKRGKLIIATWNQPREDRTFTIRLSPERGFGPVSEVWTEPMFEARLNADYEELRNAIWFPRRIQYEEIRDGKLTYREVSTIDADFVTPVSASEFTFASLALPAGRLVRHFGKHMIFDGEKLVPEGGIRGAEDVPAPLDPILRCAFLFATALAAAIAASWLGVKWFSGK